jgi:hypothetical protein
MARCLLKIESKLFGGDLQPGLEPVSGDSMRFDGRGLLLWQLKKLASGSKRVS